jgi:hypothetical protein
VPVALIGAVIAHFLPFFNPATEPGLIKIDLGIVAFFAGLFVLQVAPLDPYVEAFMLPLISALVGLFLLSVGGRPGSVGPLVSALVGFTALGSGFFFVPHTELAFGYYTAEGFLLMAAVAAAARLILVRRMAAISDPTVLKPSEPAASASQELNSRYR